MMVFKQAHFAEQAVRDIEHVMAQAISQAEGDENEACAATVEEQGRLLKTMFDNRYDALIGDLARAIRKRQANP